jgi:hypothetical protein
VIIIEPETVFAARTQSPTSAVVPTVASTTTRREARIVEALREIGCCKLWSFLSILSERDGAPDRTSARRLRLELLQQVRILRGRGLIHGVGRNSIALEKPAPKPRKPRTWRWKRSVPQTHLKQAVSAPIQRSQQTGPGLKDPVDGELHSMLNPPRAVSERVVKTQSASPSVEPRWRPFSFELLLSRAIGEAKATEVSIAAAALASRPRGRPKKWSGYLDPKDKATRIWHGRRLLTHDGRVVSAVGGLRGLVLVEWADPFAIDGRLHQVFRAPQLRVFKTPAAVALGRRKKGRMERPSALKSETSRRNGCFPCRPGRKRGRPARVLNQRTAAVAGPSLGTTTQTASGLQPRHPLPRG